MITSSDSYNTVDLGKYYAILPQKSPYSNYLIEDYIDFYKAKRVEKGFSYNSKTNKEWETIHSLRNLLKQHVDSNFEIE